MLSAPAAMLDCTLPSGDRLRAAARLSRLARANRIALASMLVALTSGVSHGQSASGAGAPVAGAPLGGAPVAGAPIAGASASRMAVAPPDKTASGAGDADALEAGVSRSRWPSRAIRLVVPLPAGGDADGLAAPLAQALSAQLGQPVQLDHRPGIGGNLACEIVAKSAPDGYTFLLGSVDQIIAAAAQPHAGCDLRHDLAPVTLLAVAPAVVVVSAKREAIRSLADLLRSPHTGEAPIGGSRSSLPYVSAGSGTLSHVAAERFRQATARQTVHRPMRSMPAALEVLGAGQADFMVAPLPLALPAIRAGRLRALAVTGSSRSFALPKVPTLAESGVAGLQARAWYALWSPTGTPPAINLAMQQGVAAVLDRKEMVATWNALGAERGGQPQNVLAQLLDSELLSWSQSLRALGVGPDRQ